MADDKWTKLPLVARHVPDSSVESDAAGNKTVVDLPGKIHIGTYIDGVFVPLLERKAAGLLADIERAKQSQTPSAEG